MMDTHTPATTFDVTYNQINITLLQEKGRLLVETFLQRTTVEPNSTCMNLTIFDYKRKTCELFFSVYVTIFLCFVGFLGNFITIAVLHRDRDPQRQKSTNWLLELLAIADSIFLAFVFIFLPIRFIAYSTDALPTVRNMFPYFMAHLHPFAYIAQIMTIWIVVFVTIDRYLAICKPLHTEWRSLRRVKMAVVVLLILAVIYNSSRFFEIEVKTIKSCENDQLKPINFRRSFAESVYYRYIYEVGCHFVFRTVGPLVVLVLLNVRIFWAIKDLNKKRREMTLEAKEEKTLTVMLIIVVVVFIVCHLPFMALSIVFPTAVFFFDELMDWEAFDCAIDIVNALAVLNSSINFLIYCLIWRKFNRIFVRMMTCSGENAKEKP